MEELTVALGARRYRVTRPWGDVPRVGLVTDVACDARGHVFVLLRRDPLVDPPAPAVIELAPDGRRLAAWGEEVADGHMLACAPGGRVLVVDRDAHEVIVFDAAGRRIGGIGTRHGPVAPFSHPCDATVAPDGTIYVADGYGAARIHRFAADLSPAGGWGAPGGGPGQFATPHSVAVMADGRIAVADRENDRVQLFDPDGTPRGAWGDVYRPMSVWPDGDGLLVTDQVPRLSRFDAAGRLTGRCRPVLNGAHGLAAAADGALYCAEIAPSRITRLAPA